jgi:DNA polymerase
VSHGAHIHKDYPAFVEECRACEECPLASYRIKVVVDRLHPATATGGLVLVGEAPGATEDKKGEVFVGKTGKHQTKLCAEEGVDDYVSINVLKCRPPHNKFPGDRESVVGRDCVLTCVDLWLDRQIGLLSPKVMVLVGGKALEWVLFRTTRPVPTMGKAMEQWYRSGAYPGVEIVATYHPSYLLRLKRADMEKYVEVEKKVRRNLRRALRLLEGKKLRGLEPMVIQRQESDRKPQQQTLF